MHTRLYSFIIKEGQAKTFINAWQEMTELLKTHAGGQGSRLHKINDTHYLAYAQWPDKKHWELADTKLPAAAESIRKNMRQVCEKVETLYEMEVVSDLLI